MHIEVSKSELLSAVKRVLPFVERKTTIPILANLHLAASGRDTGVACEYVTVTATDLDNTLTVRHNWTVKAAGAITIPARKLSDVLSKMKTLEAEMVSIQSDEQNKVTLTCGALSVSLFGMAASAYPTVSGTEGGIKSVTVPKSVVAGMIGRTRYAISQEESRYTLNGALVVVSPDSIRMVATDGHRLALSEHDGQFGETLRFLIKREAIDLLRGLLGDKGSLILSHDERNVYIVGDGWEMISRLLIGQFPNYGVIMPKDNDKLAYFTGKTLKETVARIAAFADERSHATKWELIPATGVRISADSAELGRASETVAVECATPTGSPVSIGLSAEYVRDILATLGKDQAVTLAVRDGQSAVLWTPVESNGFKTKVVLMPMRI